MTDKERRTVEGITFEITRKKMKNMRMRMGEDNVVLVSVPEKASDKQLNEFLENGVKWAKGVLSKKGLTPETAAEKREQPLEYIYHLGKKYHVEYVIADGNSISFTENNTIRVVYPRMPSREQLIKSVFSIQREEFSTILPLFAAECERLAHVRPYEWRIRDMKTKWGTCNTTDRRIWLRLGLISYPPECIKAVMIHELTHFYEHEHNKRFYELMDEFYPENKAADEILKKNEFDWWK